MEDETILKLVKALISALYHKIGLSLGDGWEMAPSSYRLLCMHYNYLKGLWNLDWKKPSEKRRTIRKTTWIQTWEVYCRSNKGCRRRRPVILLSTLDVKNAFNILRWRDVLQALQMNFQIPGKNFVRCQKLSDSRNRMKIIILEEGQNDKSVWLEAGANNSAPWSLIIAMTI